MIAELESKLLSSFVVYKWASVSTAFELWVYHSATQYCDVSITWLSVLCLLISLSQCPHIWVWFASFLGCLSRDICIPTTDVHSKSPKLRLLRCSLVVVRIATALMFILSRQNCDSSMLTLCRLNYDSLMFILSRQNCDFFWCSLVAVRIATPCFASSLVFIPSCLLLQVVWE